MDRNGEASPTASGRPASSASAHVFEDAIGAGEAVTDKLSIDSHRTRNLLPAVLIGDVRNSPLRQHRWLLQGLLRRQQAPTKLDSLSGEKE